jgi:hypothetical protein
MPSSFFISIRQTVFKSILGFGRVGAERPRTVTAYSSEFGIGDSDSN